MRALSQLGVHSRSVESIIELSPQKNDLFIKHDVEAQVKSALKMAKIEANEGHQATYYFQGDLLCSKKNQNYLKEIQKLGHEVSLHYDVLDANDGDYVAASNQFLALLEDLDNLGCTVRSVCPHGNPTKIRSGWNSNKDFFKKQEVREQFFGIIDIVVDFPKLFPNGRYVSDAGFSLREIGKIATNDKSTESAMQDGVEIEWTDVIGMVNSSYGLVLSIHPHRLKEYAVSLSVKKILFLIIKKVYLWLQNFPFVSKMANKFYSFARRF